ncbi:MAG: NAD(+) diphosphatase [Elainella sp. Prado103]|jgi:NAD+ diphosphatase|nr:NAD(+) diphosphatase [Elainella sp. Prado103]
MSSEFTSSILFPEEPRSGWWFGFVGARLLVYDEQPVRLPKVSSLKAIGIQPIRTQFIGYLQGHPCYSAELSLEAPLPDGLALIRLRELYGSLDEQLFAVAERAVQIVEWDRTHQFCGCCGTPTIQLPNERAKRCPKCALVNYPRLSPAIIVLIARDQEILLARAPRFPEGMYSILAGFVEPGESLEEAIEREVQEEVGVEIQEIHYFSSQPWPYPNSLMVGFTATYAGGEIVIDHEEIVDAGWFHKHHLPRLPSRHSIARKMIDWFVEQA